MDKSKEKIILIYYIVCSVVGALTILGYLFGILTNVMHIFILALSFALFLSLGVIIHIRKKYNERSKLMSFVYYLFDNPVNRFSILPRVILALAENNEFNNVHMRTLSITHVTNLSNIDVTGLAEKDTITYSNTYKYKLTIDNKKIPKKYVHYRGNLRTNKILDVKHKYGIQKKYKTSEPVTIFRKNSTSLGVQRYIIDLNKSNITSNEPLNVFFKLKYQDKDPVVNARSDLVIYPKQYANHVEKIKYKIKFICSKKILEKVVVSKIWEDSGVFEHLSAEYANVANKNELKINIPVDNVKYEAYHFRAYWSLISKKSTDDSR